MSTKLYVGNLPYETTESDLQTLFESAGPVSTINTTQAIIASSEINSAAHTWRCGVHSSVTSNSAAVGETSHPFA